MKQSIVFEPVYACRVDEGAKWYAGLETGVTRKVVEDGVRVGSPAECLQWILVGEGEAISVPSGQRPVIGAGGLVFEIQGNSDLVPARSDEGVLEAPAGRECRLLSTTRIAVGNLKG
jgi:hypothetical protein